MEVAPTQSWPGKIFFSEISFFFLSFKKTTFRRSFLSLDTKVEDGQNFVIVKHFLAEVLPDAKILLIVKDPIGIE